MLVSVRYHEQFRAQSAHGEVIIELPTHLDRRFVAWMRRMDSVDLADLLETALTTWFDEEESRAGEAYDQRKIENTWG